MTICKDNLCGIGNRKCDALPVLFLCAMHIMENERSGIETMLKFSNNTQKQKNGMLMNLIRSIGISFGLLLLLAWLLSKNIENGKIELSSIEVLVMSICGISAFLGGIVLNKSYPKNNLMQTGLFFVALMFLRFVIGVCFYDGLFTQIGKGSIPAMIGCFASIPISSIYKKRKLGFVKSHKKYVQFR